MANIGSKCEKRSKLLTDSNFAGSRADVPWSQGSHAIDLHHERQFPLHLILPHILVQFNHNPKRRTCLNSSGAAMGFFDDSQSSQAQKREQELRAKAQEDEKRRKEEEKRREQAKRDRAKDEARRKEHLERLAAACAEVDPIAGKGSGSHKKQEVSQPPRLDRGGGFSRYVQSDSYAQQNPPPAAVDGFKLRRF
jgi:hypothetical protein